MALFSSATRRDRAGMLLIALGATTWGTIGIVVSLLYRFANTDASSIGFLRLAIATPALLLLSRLLVGRSFIAVARRDLAVMLVIGAAFAAYQVFYFAAISYIGVAVAVLINICSAPIFIALLAWLFLNERLSIIVMLALLTALGGTVLLVGVPQPDTAAVSLLGAALALGAGLAYAVIAVSCRAIAARYHPVQPIAVAFALGTLLLMPFAISRGLVVSYNLWDWMLLVYLGLVPTVLGYALYLWGLRSTTATIAAILTLLEPLISTVLAVFLGERLSATAFLGGMLLLGSMALLYMQQPRTPRVDVVPE